MISIIVPVYNSAKYLDQCIQSILSQTYENFELLLVDDGSTDGSSDLCDIYASKDQRVKVFHKQNGGASAARNLGLCNANGEWIAFVDSDDWVHRDFLLKRYEAAIRTNSDVAYCDLELVYETHREYCQAAELNMNESTQVNSWILSRKTYSPILLIKNEIFKANKLSYLEGLHFCEDFNLILKVLHFAKKVVRVPEALYYYNKSNENSTMHKLHLYRDDLQEVYLDLIETFKKCGAYEKYEKMLSWCILEYKLVSMVNDEHRYEELADFCCESNKYIFSNEFIDIKSKFLLFCYTHHMSLIADFMLKIYKLRKK